ncbi:hypothetical protein TRVL_04769 [Trypanosoma vivax]|nr:hypothetical protein TRVL_04769 [Trypanosoma vivax]
MKSTKRVALSTARLAGSLVPLLTFVCAAQLPLRFATLCSGFPSFHAKFCAQPLPAYLILLHLSISCSTALTTPREKACCCSFFRMTANPFFCCSCSSSRFPHHSGYNAVLTHLPLFPTSSRCPPLPFTAMASCFITSCICLFAPNAVCTVPHSRDLTAQKISFRPACRNVNFTKNQAVHSLNSQSQQLSWLFLFLPFLSLVQSQAHVCRFKVPLPIQGRTQAPTRKCNNLAPGARPSRTVVLVVPFYCFLTVCGSQNRPHVGYALCCPLVTTRFHRPILFTHVRDPSSSSARAETDRPPYTYQKCLQSPVLCPSFVHQTLHAPASVVSQLLWSYCLLFAELHVSLPSG